jgi:ornithine carbamoyltransferase
MDLDRGELKALIRRAIELKSEFKAGRVYEPLRNKTLAMLFDKSSTRTRLSFEAAITQFGGNAAFLEPGSTQLDRGEPIADTARVMSRFVDAVVIRTSGHAMVENFARHASIPVINGLTDDFHPCQLLADIQTFVELRGEITGRQVAWVGDGNNVCQSWINAARQFEFDLAIATPESYHPRAELLQSATGYAHWSPDARQVVTGADIVVTDTWASMGQESEKAERERVFAPFRVDSELMSLAMTDAIFMHCLPAYRGNEVSADVLDGPQSVVWDQAENRLHAQKALLEFLLT